LSDPRIRRDHEITIAKREVQDLRALAARGQLAVYRDRGLRETWRRSGRGADPDITRRLVEEEDVDAHAIDADRANEDSGPTRRTENRLELRSADEIDVHPRAGEGAEHCGFLGIANEVPGFAGWLGARCATARRRSWRCLL